MDRISGKRVVITGAASGLGRSLALAFASRGCQIGIADIKLDEAKATLDMVHERGASGEVYQVDVSKAAEVEAMVDHFFQEFGGVDIAVNNAGVVVAGNIGNDIPLEDWEWLMGVNLWGVVYGCHYFIPRMKAQGHGHIVNTASVSGLLSLSEMGPYSVAKAAVVSLSEVIRVEQAPHNINVTVVCPFFFKSNLLDNLRYQDEYQNETAHIAFNCARKTTNELAEDVIKAVSKKKFYCVPMLSGKIHWAEKRLSPSFYHWQFAAAYKYKIFRPVFARMARHGLV